VDSRPNILWIVTTQWRAQAFGHAGDPNARTPRLDAFAAASIRCREAVTPHPFGPFARAALLTGVPCPANGVRDYYDPLPDGTRTIAHALRDRGYTTAFLGKWHLARRDSAAPLVGETHARQFVPPESRGGFDRWTGFESGFLLNDPWLHGDGLPNPQRFPGYQSDVLADRAIATLPTLGPGPWFLVVSLEPPHPPYDAPAAGVRAPAPGSLTLAPNIPRGGEAEARARRELSGYYAHLEATDRAIGRLIDAAPSSTAVVFTSVHGDMHGSHGLFRKGWPHEESIRVPLLVRPPAAPGGPPGPPPVPRGACPAPPACLGAPHPPPLRLRSLPPRPPFDDPRLGRPPALVLPARCRGDLHAQHRRPPPPVRPPLARHAEPGPQTHLPARRHPLA
jgi:arylsulfatase A-like enzyme